MHSFPEELISIDSNEKKSHKMLCIAFYCYSITTDKYWWFGQNGSFFLCFQSLSYNNSSFTGGEAAKGKRRNNLFNIGI